MDTFTLQSWNLWEGCTRVEAGLRKAVRVAARFPAHVYALQETAGERSQYLTSSLGYAHAQQGPDTAVASDFHTVLLPTPTEPYATCALLSLGNRKVKVWSVHLSPDSPEQRLAHIKRVLGASPSALPTVIAGTLYEANGDVDATLRAAGYADVSPAGCTVDFIYARTLQAQASRLIDAAQLPSFGAQTGRRQANPGTYADRADSPFPSDHPIVEVTFRMPAPPRRPRFPLG